MLEVLILYSKILVIPLLLLSTCIGAAEVEKHQIPSLSVPEINRFARAVTDENDCYGKEDHELITSKEFCVDEFTYFSDFDLLELWVVVGNRYPGLENILEEPDTKTHYQKTLKALNYFEDYWGTNYYRESWKPGKLSNKIDSYFKDKKDVQAIEKALIGCIVLAIEVKHYRGSYVFTRNSFGNINPTYMGEFKNLYNKKNLLEQHGSIPNKSRTPYLITSCLNPNAESKFKPY